jgi:predicted outer membrane repeat protein
MKLKKSAFLPVLLIFVLASAAYCENEDALSHAWINQGVTLSSYELTTDVIYGGAMPAAAEEEGNFYHFDFSVKSATYTVIITTEAASSPFLPPVEVIEIGPAERHAIDADKKSAAFTFVTKSINAKKDHVKHSFEYLTIKNGFFSNTDAEISGGGAYGNYGAALAYYWLGNFPPMTDRTIEFKDIHFISNTAVGANAAGGENVYGGAVFIGGRDYPQNYSFYIPSIEVTFSSGTRFIANRSDGYGGAYASLYGNINTFFGAGSFEDSTLFSGNSAGKDGGAVYFKGGAGSTITFRGSFSFDSNTAAGSGGAIYYEKTNVSDTNRIVFGNAGHLGLSTAQFSGNSAGNLGGAIYSLGTSLQFYDEAFFTLNSALSGGGAIYMTSGALVFSTHCATFLSYNSTSDDVSADGGAIFKNGDGAVSFNAAYLQNNKAGGRGGAIYSAGGAITFTGAAQITSNVSGADGGAIFKNGDGSMSFNAAYLQNNKAGGRGGAIYSAGGAITFAGMAQITSNVSGADGGAVYKKSGNIYFYGISNISTNPADGHGGALYSDGVSAVVFQGITEFQGNKSLFGSGGALYISDNTNTTFSENVSFTSNVAALGGGALFNIGGSITFSKNAVFSRNKTTDVSSVFSAGGAIYADGGSYKFKGDAEFYDNSTAFSRGGAIFARNSDFTFGSYSYNKASFMRNTINGNGAEGGAAVYSADSVFVFTPSAVDFIENETLGITSVSGGAIYALRSNYTFNGAVNFTSNAATAMGGGAALSGSEAYFKGEARFQNNSAADGGALYLGGTRSKIEFQDNASFIQNKSLQESLNGGGAVLMYASEGTHNVSFAAGKTASFIRNGSLANGGAFAVYSGAQNIVNFYATARFSSNTASGSGGAFYSSVYANGTGQYNFLGAGEFSNNEAGISGGAIYSYGNSSFNINTNIVFINNGVSGTDSNGGGAIYSAASAFTFAGSAAARFQNNSASSRGGAVYQDKGSFNFQADALFSLNSAGFLGGAVYASGGEINFDKNVIFESNTASGDLITSGGGAVYALNQSLTFSNGAEFGSNKAAGITNGSGGALYASESDLIFLRQETSFKNNEAMLRGGAVYQNGGSMIFSGTNALFENNTAGISGGALYLNGEGSITFVNARFVSNSAGADGGAVYLKGAGLSELAEVYFSQDESTLTIFSGNSANGLANALHLAGNAYAQFIVSQNQIANINDSITSEGINNFVTVNGKGTFNMNDNISGYETLDLRLDGVIFNLAGGKNMSLDNLSVLNGAVLNMQNASAQRVSVAGDFNIEHGSELKFDVFSYGESDIIEVDGKAVLDGNISVKAGVGVYDNQWFTLINAQDGFDGTDFEVKFFDDGAVHKTDPRLLKYDFEYNKDQNRFLIVVNGIKQSCFSSLDGLGKNQKNVAKMYDDLSAHADRPLANLIDGIDEMQDISRQKQALLETSPYFIANALNYNFRGRTRRPLYRHIEKTDKICNIWAYADGNSAALKADENSSGDFKTNSYGVVFGADKSLSESFILGFFGQYKASKAEQEANKADISGLGGGIYAIASKGIIELKASLGYEGHNYDIERSVNVSSAGIVRLAKSEFGSYILEADIEAGCNISLSDIFSINPFAGFNAVSAHYGGFSESGADIAGLDVAGSNAFLSNVRIGISANSKISKFNFGISIEYDALLDAGLPELSATLNARAKDFKTVGADPGQNAAVFNLSASCELTKNLKAYAAGAVKISKNLSDVGVNAGIKYSLGKDRTVQ